MSTDIFKSLDALNKEISEWERTFAARSFVVRGEVPLPSGGYLAYGKSDGGWRILVVTDSGESPLVNSSIERRLEAIELFEPLAVVLRRARDAALDRLAKRIDHLRQAREKL